MRIVGIDPGYDRLGWGIIDRNGSKLTMLDCGVIQTERVELAARLHKISEELSELLGRFRPDALALERLLFTKSKTTVFDVAKAAGVVLLKGFERGLESVEYTPSEVKLAITGTGAADKRQVEFMVVKLLSLGSPPKPDDACDALAVAICHAFRSKVVTTSRM